MKMTTRCCSNAAIITFFTLLELCEIATAALPNVDFDRMGRVGLAGTFAGLDLFDNSTSLSFDPTSSTLLSRASDGSLSRLGTTNAGGRISAGCPLGDSFYVTGSFSSIDGTSASNVASFSPSSGSFSALGSGGPNGEVNAIFCDASNNKVWVGGSFTSPGKAVAVWDTKANSWSAPPFGGLSGAASEVLSITTNSSAKSLFFAGSFITSFGSNTTTVINNTNNPNVPFSSGATPFSSSLVPVPLQNAQIEASPSTSDPNFSNINNVLCPSGADGPGQSWFAADGGQAVVTVRTFTQLMAVGLRLGNTFQSGHGTTTFSVAAIPENGIITLTFVDPATGSNQTCSDACPLSTNSSVLYQDFLFSQPSSLTGFQLTLSQFTGSSAGLHIMQLLSSGAFASAVSSGNGISCFAPNPSNITLVGQWTDRQVTTNIPATIQDVLTASVDVGTSSANGPSITWMPYVSASGDYDVSMLIPGCVNFQDCDSRTSVKVTVFPGGGLDPAVKTISQQNNDDAVVSIYSGPIFPSSPDFVVTVTMSLADQPAGQGSNGKYELVADRIELTLLSVTGNFSSNSSNSTTSNSTSTRQGFGFFEWPFSETQSVNAESTLSNTTQTALDNVGFQLLSAIGANSVASTNSAVVAVAHHSSGAIFLGGNFSLPSGSNIISFKNGALAPVANGGLNGPVTSLLIEGDTLFVGGAFTDTASPSTNGAAHGIVAYNVNQNSWTSLGAGVNGAVSGLSFAAGQVEAVGNFTNVLPTPGSTSGPTAGGFAVWNVGNSTWGNTGGFLVGSMTFVGNSTSPSKGQQQSQILAGNVASSLKFGTSGFVLLQNGGKDGIPDVSTLSIQLEDIGSNLTTPAQRRRRRSTYNANWLYGLSMTGLFKRQSSSPAPLPASPPTPAPAVLSGVFWTNSSDSQDRAILGGNFSFQTGSSGPESSAVAIYNLKSGSVTALAGNPINGTVRALLVQGNTLYIGGDFTVTGSSIVGIAIYDLAKQSLDMSGLQPLQGASGANAVVRSLSTSAARSNAIIVAGSFSTAGGSACAGICQLDISSKQWSQLGTGINGEVASVAYGGDNQDLLFASGSIALRDGTPANVAMFATDNSTWSAVGQGSQLPGPVTAITVDDGNSSSIFVGGRTSDGSSSFLSFWNGANWTALNGNFGASTAISQLALVPLQDTHSANGVIENDRMLMISGSLNSTSFGDVSTALYDGQTFFPYIVTSSPSGSPGFVSSLFTSISNFSFNHRHVLAVGVVILISIAIAAGVVFFLVLLGILWTLFARRDSNKGEFAAYEDDDDSTNQRPSSLLEHINAATRTAIIGGGAASPFDALAKNKEEEIGGHGVGVAAGETGDPFVNNNNDDNFLRADTPSDVMGGLATEEQGRIARARYSFDGKEEGELPLAEGMSLEVLDDRDQNWWYARDTQTGKEGVVPAAYVI